MTTYRFSLRLTLQSRRGRADLLCRLALLPTRLLADDLARELVVVVSSTAPHLRWLTVYRSAAGADHTPPAA